VLALGLAMSAAFVLAAIGLAAVAAVRAAPAWAAIHLAMAGAATVAIGAFMPHFAVTIAGTRPAPAPRRLASLALLASGAALAVLGVTMIGGRLAGIGAVLMIGGLALVAGDTMAPLRDPLARKHRIASLAYGVALLELVVGIALGGAAALGVDPVIDGWATLRGSHALLTLFGAVSLTIFATLIFLAPTVFGARLRPNAALAVGTVGMLTGPITAAIGFATAWTPLAVLGMIVTLAGAIGQLAYVADAYRRRGTFTSEHDWRLVVTAHLGAGTAWFVAGVGVAAAELIAGRPVHGWSIGALAVPMVAGWMLQELVGSWTHLAPAVTEGGPVAHARQRRILASVARTRLVAWNVGVGLTWAGLVIGFEALAGVGAVVLVPTIGLSVVLLVRALLVRDG
jgi:hypothetical protein